MQLYGIGCAQGNGRQRNLIAGLEEFNAFDVGVAHFIGLCNQGSGGPAKQQRQKVAVRGNACHGAKNANLRHCMALFCGPAHGRRVAAGPGYALPPKGCAMDNGTPHPAGEGVPRTVRTEAKQGDAAHSPNYPLLLPFFDENFGILNFPLFVARRIIFNTQPSFSRFIIRMAMAATAISVAAMIVTLCMVNGFQRAVSEKVFSFWGHVRVQSLEPLRSTVSEEVGFASSDSIAALVEKTPHLSHYQSFAVKSVVLRTAGNFEGILLKGVDERFDKHPFGFMVEGRSINFGSGGYSNDVLLSREMAARLQVKPGDTLQCLFVRNAADMRTRPLVVSGLFHTGVDEYDNNFALADLRFLRRLNLWDSTQIGGYELWLDQPKRMDTLAKQLSRALPQGLEARSIRALYPNVFDWLGIQDQTKLIVVVVMTVVATINLITCLLILVMERTRMVGALKAMGLGNGGVQAIFWYYAGWIALMGTGLGLAVGLGICWLQMATGIIKMDESTYFVRTVPVHIIWWQIAVVVLAAVASCLLWLRLPLLYVNKISPVKAAGFK
ncbi:MAG: ABC transporter permease [Bacteroidetes bacterium]|nr:MAG: ABC transporter permease [Bacteroidota bacterium]